MVRDCLSLVNTKQMRPDNSKVIFENGVFDLDRKEFVKEVDKGCVQFSSMPYNFDNAATCPLWRQFLDSVLPEKGLSGGSAGVLGSIFIGPPSDEDRDDAYIIW